MTPTPPCSLGATKLNAPNRVREIFDQHADFVWRVLARAGVRDADLQDATQEVFIVVTNKLEQHDGATKVTTWLYGIALRIGANFRRKVDRKREDLSDDAASLEGVDHHDDPEEAMVRAEARTRLAQLLEDLSAEQRIVFEMFELEEMTCQAIADVLGIPLGTTYTRLRAARAAVATKARRLAEAEGQR